MKTLVLLSEPWQVDALPTFADGEQVVALDAEVEDMLAAKNISCISIKEYRTPSLAFRDAAYSWAKQVLEDPEAPFATYRDVPLSRVYFYPLYLYFTRVAYWLDATATLLERHSDVSRIVVYPSAEVASETMGDLAAEEIAALVDATRLLGSQKGIEVEVRSFAHAPEKSRRLFKLQRSFFGALVFVWNGLMRLLPRRRVRILVSDYWRNISPLAPYLHDTELVFIDRLEALAAGTANLWRWRMRLYHLEQFARPHTQPQLLPAPAFSAPFRGVDMGVLLFAAHTALVQRYTPKAVRDIDGAYGMLERVQPSVVALRVSTAPQRHYAILALVATKKGIPSVEFQHGWEYSGPDSFTLRKNARHLGVYGKRIKQELVAAGIDPERISIVGSPRFDPYSRSMSTSAREDAAVLSVLCIFPDLSYGDGWDTFDVDSYLINVAQALRGHTPVRVTIKLRGTRREAYFRRRIAEIFAGIQHEVVRDEALATLFAASDLVISYYSTVILEAMQCDVPVLFFAEIPIEQRFVEHLADFEQSGALKVARTAQELSSALKELAAKDARDEIAGRAHEFLIKDFAFDGHAAERAAGLVEQLARRG